jgi:hypothetical protein
LPAAAAESISPVEGENSKVSRLEIGGELRAASYRIDLTSFHQFLPANEIGFVVGRSRRECPSGALYDEDI